MSKTITVRLNEDLSTWLAETAQKTGLPQGQIVREELEKARRQEQRPSFMRLAGMVKGPKDLSQRKGYSGK
jgi:predicted transcriptional regulator